MAEFIIPGATPPSGQGDARAAGGNGDLIKDTTTANFVHDVIEASRGAPVIVDFWAPWCGPCKQLTPVLEKVVKAARGAVRLVKMNIDDHPEVAGQLGVQSIPAVFAFKNGQPVDGFMGALPESQIKAFIERLAGGEALAGGPDDLAVQGEAFLAEKATTEAAQLFAAALQADPQHLGAIGGLARCYIEAGDLTRAEQTLGIVPPGKEEDAAISGARSALELAKQAAELGDAGELGARLATHPDDHQARFDLAMIMNAKGARHDAADALLEIIRKDRNWNNEAARKQLLQFFEAWGPADEATKTGRRKLSALLFS